MQAMAHIAMLPFPAQGHVSPMVRLACLLARSGKIRITFFCSEWFAESARCALETGVEHLIDVVSIPNGAIEENEMKGNESAVVQMIEAAQQMEAPLEQGIRERSSDDSSSKICCLISEAFFDWPQDVANRIGIPRFGLWSSTVPTLILTILFGKLKADGLLPSARNEGSWLQQFPGVSNLQVKNLPFCFYSDQADAMREEKGRRIPEASCLILNTFDDLEGEILDGLRTLVPSCLTVGPLLPSAALSIGEGVVPSVKLGAMEEDWRCIEWLNSQPPRSVLYISFGSLANLSLKQMEELVLGIEASGVSFLWSLRPSFVEGLSESEIFRGFVTRSKEKGIIVPWAPQIEVLGHSSIAVFLTHCGWNSITEAIWNGVPLLTWPCFAEQNLNAHYVVEKWKIGFAFNERAFVEPDTFITAVEVEATVRRSMEDEGLRTRATVVKDSARRAMGKDGTSSSNLNKLVCTILSFV